MLVQIHGRNESGELVGFRQFKVGSRESGRKLTAELLKVKDKWIAKGVKSPFVCTEDAPEFLVMKGDVLTPQGEKTAA